MELPGWLPVVVWTHLCALLCRADIDWFEMVNLCQAQCEVFCRENQHTCKDGTCPDPLRPVWQHLCQLPESCVSSCIDRHEEIYDKSKVPPIPETKLRFRLQRKLQWNRTRAVNQTTFYLIQGQRPDSDWQVHGWVENSGVYMLDTQGYCDIYRFRVAAVNQYGALGFSTPQSLIPKPKIHFQSPKFSYHKNEFLINLHCMLPSAISHENNTECEWDVPSFSAQCPYILPVMPIIRVLKGRDGHWFQIGVAEEGYGCNYTGRVRLTTDCKSHSEWVEVPLNISDCSHVTGFSCPLQTGASPGRVDYVKIIQNNSHVHVRWEEPVDKGSQGVAKYAVEWGICHHWPFSDFVNMYKLDKTTIVEVTETTLNLTVNSPSNQYGVRVAALGPGQATSSINFKVMTTHCAERTAPPNHLRTHGKELKSENGVKIHGYPESQRIVVSWPHDKKKEAVKQVALRWGPLSDQSGDVHNLTDISVDSVMEVENSTLLPGNLSKINITIEKPGERYGLQVRRLHYLVSDDSQVDWNSTKVLQFDVPLPSDHNQSAPPVESSTSNVSSSGTSRQGYKHVEATTDPSVSTQLVHKPSHPFTSSTKTRNLVIYIVVPSVAAILLLAVPLGVLHRKRKQPRLVESVTTSNHSDEGRYNTIRFSHSFTPPSAPGDSTVTVVADKWEIPRTCLQVGPVLGNGAFGQVVKGCVIRSCLCPDLCQSVIRELDQSSVDTPSSDVITVAIKMLQEDIEDTYRQDFLKEIKLMKSIGCHSNIVSMLGCCTLSDPVCLVVEHVPYGDLLSHLRDVRVRYQQGNDVTSTYTNMAPITLAPVDLLSFARQIAVGMEFLSQKGYVHRDLAARNVLVGEHKTVKIGDFGLARYVYDDKVYVNRRGGKLPIKWMSIEAIFDLTFSTASDVWSFGIVLYELCTLGGTPYPTLDNTELLRELRKGWRMSNPDGCSPHLYQLMLDCWKEIPSRRPSFTAIRQSLESMLEQSSSVDYIQLPLLNNLDSDVFTPDSGDGLPEDWGEGNESHDNWETDNGHVTDSVDDTSKSGPAVSPAPPVSLDKSSHDHGMVTKDVDDDVFDSASNSSDSICDCTHSPPTSDFHFGESCPKCGKLQGLLKDKVLKLTAIVCHSKDRTGDLSTGTGEFLLRSDCIRSDRIESDISTDSRDSEASVSSSTYLLSSPSHAAGNRLSPEPPAHHQETRL